MSIGYLDDSNGEYRFSGIVFENMMRCSRQGRIGRLVRITVYGGPIEIGHQTLTGGSSCRTKYNGVSPVFGLIPNRLIPVQYPMINDLMSYTLILFLFCPFIFFWKETLLYISQFAFSFFTTKIWFTNWADRRSERSPTGPQGLYCNHART